VALPVAPQSRQRSLAVAVQACLRQAEAYGDADAGGLRGRAGQLMADVPDAARWAAAFAARRGLDEQETSRQRFRRHSGPGIVNLATRAISRRPSPRRTDCSARRSRGDRGLPALQPVATRYRSTRSAAGGVGLTR
jgi:hypothetical protein